MQDTVVARRARSKHVMRKRAKIGDVIEIDTGDGLAYAHYSHKHKPFGALLRVFNRRYPERPADLAAMVAGPPSTCVLSRSVRRCTEGR